MTYQPGKEQQAIIDAVEPVVVVIGGAGTGKTTTAAAAAGKRLELINGQRNYLVATSGLCERGPLPPRKRVLLVSFSKTAVTQILDRAAPVLGPYREMLDVVTFHGMAWRILSHFGRFYGHPHPFRVQSAAEAALSVDFPGATYEELVPAATQLLQIPVVRDYYERRYVTIMCDEFQDTSNDEWAFIQALAPSAQRILLGDPNQCIYAGMKHIDPQARVDEACALRGARRINLPPVSHRDPSGALPAAALAAKNRTFGDPAIANAVRSGRILLHSVRSTELAAAVAGVIDFERAAKKTVSAFTHTHAATAELAAHLTAAAIDHEQVGFTESFGDSLQAQFASLRWALDGTPGARAALAVYSRSISRGREKSISEAIITKSMPELETALRLWAADFKAAAQGDFPDYDDLLHRLADLHHHLGFPRGLETWLAANTQLRRAVRVLQRGGTIDELELAINELRASTLVGAKAPRAKAVQIMNLHQTKGREADATVLLLQPDEFHGYEREPYPTGSRLLYVCLTRARERAHIVLPDDTHLLHGLWAPFVDACMAAELV
ncbi:UvrD-helicase domain-containing protein [Agilicoccus flavus]|uniref:UvrD-helicase domain-containing protein n=1 Tax=Agilicoccus flavus TaxID=2775968 RepID=UPI001CF6E59A|nr:UvrD-helicase domain-containing protein [Agilicoccus flavus]